LGVGTAQLKRAAKSGPSIVNSCATLFGFFLGVKRVSNTSNWSLNENTQLSEVTLTEEWRLAHRTVVADALAVSTTERAQGARMCVNMAAAHVPEFVQRGGSYKNAYDLDKEARIVGAPSNVLSETRRVVDSLLPLPATQTAESTYFGAVETTGCGVRFYGDFCLVLCRTSVPGDTVILDRNSYDLVRPPLNSWRAEPKSKVTARELQNKSGIVEAQKLAGEFTKDLPSMVMVNLAKRGRLGDRRLTIGQLSDCVLDDEDYIEVLKANTFTIEDIDDVRTSAAEAAAESLIGDHLNRGPPPNFAELLWRSQRRRAASVLRLAARSVRIVTTSGRVRS
jgi:hypothetical protein